MYYTIQLSCQHQPHLCKCKHNARTAITTEEATEQLLIKEFNPALSKYIAKYAAKSQSHLDHSNKHPLQKIHILEKQQDTNHVMEMQPYRSIVEEKKLKYLLPREEEIESNTTQNKNNQPIQNIVKKPSESNQMLDNRKEKETIKQGKETIKKVKPKNQTEQQVGTFYKDLKLQSRYLSNTAFRKYFNRQCFENYGHENVHDEADGFVYGNYLKTYNINPHSGQNLPENQETFYHALVSASPDKFKQYTQHQSKGKDQTKSKSTEKNNKHQPIIQPKQLKQQIDERVEQKSYFQKDKVQMEKLISDNLKHHKLENKYQHLHLRKDHVEKINSPKAPPKSPKQQNMINVKSANLLQTTTNNAINSFQKDMTSSKKNIPSPKHNISSSKIPSPKHSIPSPKDNLIHPSSSKDNIDMTQLPHYKNSPPEANHWSYQKCSSHQKQQVEQMHSSNHKTLNKVECQCCREHMKRMILDLAERDADLASRIVSSAKKQTMYKNYSLNNFDNAGLNPHNYRNSDGKLNIYEG